MEEMIRIKNELERTKTELSILYEISNAMRTTLKLDEILYIILTGVTSHAGLGFNRAVLFLINDKDGLIEGKIAIGPSSYEEANRIWKQIEIEKMDLDDLISVYKATSNAVESGFNKQVKNLRVPLKEQAGGLLALCVLDGMPLHLNRETIRNYLNDPVIQILKSEELLVVPLKAKDRVNGIIIADNFVTKKPITKDDIRLLLMLGNQAGLAIENSQLFEKTVLQGNTDSLTEVWNHGYFQYLLSAEVEKSKAINAPLSLVMVDIDDFKIYNDTLGHQAGDKILKELAVLLKNQSRKMDFVCRYGGEEFSIILPLTDKQEALQIADRLRQTVEKHAFTHQDILPAKKFTVSVGVSSFPENGSSPSELITYSDQMMYQAKRNGKNSTCG